MRRLTVCGGVALCLGISGCAKSKETTPPDASSDAGPSVDSNTYVSSEEEKEFEEEAPPDDGFAAAYDCDCKVTSPEDAHELADTAVADRLNPKQTWTASPVFPASWPITDRTVRVFFFPMARDPGNLSQGVLLSAAYSVDISLEDGTTQVNEHKKSRKLGVVEDRRPSMLEGWDTHFVQAPALASNAATLGQSLAAFAEDLGEHWSRTTVVVMTEFGRRAYESTSLGTDHGRAGAMFVLGGGLGGGHVVADWPGLGENALVDPGDLRVTIDYRDVLIEVLRSRHRVANAEALFPGPRARSLSLFG